MNKHLMGQRKLINALLAPSHENDIAYALL